jgi:hypothetical protein
MSNQSRTAVVCRGEILCTEHDAAPSLAPSEVSYPLAVMVQG